MSIIKSSEFDDVYFSVEDGLEETRHVFLKGNDLPAIWQGKDSFVIAETGFGTGLNFLATWQLFEQTAQDFQTLHFISFEKYPLSKDRIKDALSRWEGVLGDKLDLLLANYPLRVGGFHPIHLTEHISLLLVFDDVNRALPQLQADVDSWFLDGFAPAKNPEMWSDTVFRHMKRLSHEGTSFSTFTAAGDVKRGLEASGFVVEKVEGFGRKRDMLKGRFVQKKPKKACVNRPKYVAVIGAGVAGLSCAVTLRAKGVDVTVFDKADQVGHNGSSNRIGLYNPRFSKKRSGESDFYGAAYALVYRLLTQFQQKTDVGFTPNGTLHLIYSGQKDERFHAFIENWGWHEDHARIISSKEAGEIAGTDILEESLFLPDAGAVSPAKLCPALAEDLDVRLNVDVKSLEQTEDGWIVNGECFDAVVLACNAFVKDFEQAKWLPLYTVRGQVSWVKPNKILDQLKTNLCYGGYITAEIDGIRVVGSTFQRSLTHRDLLQEDHDDVLEDLEKKVPALTEEPLELVGGKASLRPVSQDRFPVIGALGNVKRWILGEQEDYRGLYVSTAYGSYGMSTSFLGAEYITNLMLGEPCCLPQEAIETIEPARYLRRASNKGRLSALLNEAG